MKPKYFGTDGIRGRVGIPPIDVESILRLGWALGKFIAKDTPHGKVLIGKDTRVSGYMIESALQAGLSTAGIDVHRLGVIPTSAIAYLTRTFRAQVGIVISASHNLYHDNGVKFFNSEGYKLSMEEELLIEKYFENPIDMPPDIRLGRAYIIGDAQGRYIEFCKSCIQHKTNLKGLKIVLDCANGATYHIAPHVLTELGADVLNIHDKPNGFNINKKAGACSPEVLQHNVISHKANLGIALDGDGDRLIMIDHLGNILDGDDIIYIILRGLLQAKLFSGGVVGTVLSNMGLEQAVKNLGIHFLRTDVGDQKIIQSLLQKNWQLGGEPSGHIIYLAVSTTGDGIIAALQVLQTMHDTGDSLYALKQGLHKFPQKMVNIECPSKKIPLTNPEIQKMISTAEEKIKNNGRVLVRYSGTESLLRVMVEGEDEKKIDEITEELAQDLTTFFQKNA